MVDVEPVQSAWCSLCERLHQNSSSARSIVNLETILNKEKNCKLPPYMDELNYSNITLANSTIISWQVGFSDDNV